MIETLAYTTRPGPSSSSRYIEVYDPDGNFVSRHTTSEECTESIVQYVQSRNVGGRFELRYPNKTVDVGLATIPVPDPVPDPDPTPDPDPVPDPIPDPVPDPVPDPIPDPGQPSYVATHYATVTGAGSHNGSLGNEWTLLEAMQRAVAGNRVRVAGGDYVGPANGDRWNPSFSPSNNGTASNPIVFFAAIPAATNPSSTGLSRLRNNAAIGSNSVTYGVRGYAPFGNQHIIFDGFWTDQANGSAPQPSGGQCCIGGGAIGVQIRRGLFDRATVDGGDNHAAIFAQASIDTVISDCRFRGGNSGANSSHNDAAVSWYGNVRMTLQYSTFERNGSSLMGCGTFVKGPGGNGGNDGVIRFCDFKDNTPGGAACVEVNDAARTGVDIYQNIMVGGRAAFSMDWSSGNNKRVLLRNNVMLNTTGDIGDAGGVISFDGITVEDQVRVRDNIIAHRLDTGNGRGLIFLNTCRLDRMAQWDWNYYHMLSGSPRFRHWAGGNNDYTSLSAWVAYWGGNADSHSQYGGNPFVADGNYRVTGAALTASSVGGPVGAYLSGNEEIGVRANPTY